MKREFDTPSRSTLQPADGARRDVTLDQRIGEILVRVGKMPPEGIELTRAHQASRGERFGESAVALGLVTDADVRWALAQQFHYPYVLESAGSHRPELVVAADPFGAQSEALRELRSRLLFGVLSAEPPTRPALAFVSPDRGDGKSFLVANLAVALSQMGARTLLVDADMRQPRQHGIFDTSNASSLSGVLSGRTDAALTRNADFPNLYVLPVGTVPPNPLELLLRPAFKLLMRECVGKFDYVMVDTPAAAHGSDANVIAATCGAALAIGRQGRTSLASMGTLLQGLTTGPTKIAGVVMNEY